MALTQVRKQIEAIIISTLRAIFSEDTSYPYNDDDRETTIIITPSFSTSEVENKMPHIVINDISYGLTQQFLGNNFSKTRHTATSKPEYEYVNLIPFSATLHCLSINKAEAEELGDMLVQHFGFLNKSTFISFGMVIETVQVGAVDPRKQYPQFQFGCGVNIQGTVKYTWVVKNAEDPNIVINRVRVLLSNYE